ncbi:MAG: Mrp/NBP35 family ATP-binding protein, partial [Pseudomonadota bacterium]
MAITRDEVLRALRVLKLPDGRDVVEADFVRALSIDGPKVRFVLEVPPAHGPAMEPVRAAAEKIVVGLDGVDQASVLLTAHSGAPPAPAAKQPPQLKVGGHPKPSADRAPIAGVDRILAIASGKGGVGKSTVSCNLAVALVRSGRRVGLLDADIYGPSQPRMMGISQRPASPDGKTILPLTAHGVTMMSIGLMLEPDQAVVWRGPMLMGALQQMLGQVAWGDLDVLLVDLPPGTGDVQLTLSQKAQVTGAVVVSTPQDVALLDARKAMNMFEKT